MAGPLLAAGAAGTALVMGVAVGVVVLSVQSEAAQCLPTSVSVSGTVPASASLDATQQARATTIVSEVVKRRMPSRAAVIAVSTALQESTLRNLANAQVPESLFYPHDGVAPGDLDSVGLFQQRASQGWGAVQQLLTPTYATNAFLDRLAQVPGWQAMPVAQAAQAVQRSAYPDAYARWEQQASTIVGGLLGRSTDAGTGAQTVTDGSGLLVEGDGLAQGIASSLPLTYHGGPVTTSAQRSRTTAQGVADLTARRDELPGTILVSLGTADGLKPADAARFTTQARKVLTLAGENRTVYWLTSPAAPVAAAALRGMAATDDRLQLIDADRAGAAQPGWLDDAEALTPAGVAAIGKLVRNALAENEDESPTAASGDGCADGLGGYSAVPVADCSFALPKGNPRGCQDAIRWALAQQDGPAQWYRRCLNFVARAYGYSHSGIPRARDAWFTANPAIRHPGDVLPPAGALVFWNNGSAGHVALSAGNGMVISNDIRGAGTIALVPLAEITERWNAPYLGWTDPYFPLAG